MLFIKYFAIFILTLCVNINIICDLLTHRPNYIQILPIKCLYVPDFNSYSENGHYVWSSSVITIRSLSEILHICKAIKNILLINYAHIVIKILFHNLHIIFIICYDGPYNIHFIYAYRTHIWIHGTVLNTEKRIVNITI